MSYTLIVGDLEPDMEIDVTTAGAAANLTGAIDVSMRWTKPDGTTSLVPLVAIDLAAGRLKRVWVAGDTAQAGTHYAQVVVTRSNGEVQTFPNDGSVIIWNIYKQLGT